ncbi:MAG: DoxX family membrane protein [Bacteroidales bacterium]|nr:DoxX family membrane protein [Bacteroidales bacterium]
MKAIRLISRIVIGIVFVFSGFVKAVDPLGTTYKFIDYFQAFNMSFLDNLALPLAILQNVLELIIGINLLLGYE